MSALPSKTGAVPRAYPEIRWRHSGRAATLSASRKNGQRRTPTTYLLMPNMAHSKSYLAFDFGAESGRVILAHLHLGIQDRKSTRLNSSHSQISYAVFC